MRKLVRNISLLLCSCLAAIVGACSEQEPGEISRFATDAAGKVDLTLNVSIGRITGVGSTRAEDEGNTFGFEQSDIPQELINTLRIIIVRPDYTVEYNRFINLKDKALAKVTSEDLIDRDELTFSVSTSQGYVDNEKMTRTEKKRIYLIANEAGLDGLSSNFTATGETIAEMLEKIAPEYYPSEEEIEAGAKPNRGTRLDPYSVERWIIFNEWGEGIDDPGRKAVPVVDNSGDAQTFIPMTEFFDIDVVSSFKIPENNEGETDEDKPRPSVKQEADLFVTRNFVKFVFSASSANESFTIRNVTFQNLSQKEYLFPFNTVYSPGKAIDNTSDREIVSFQTPGTAGNLIRPYTFTPPTENPFRFQQLAEGASETKSPPAVYAPLLYFCETNNFEADNGTPVYRIGVDVEFQNNNGTTQEASFKDVILPNLPNSLPRNTIVKVNLTFKDRRIAAEATVLPYTAVELFPQFGFSKPETDRLSVAPSMVLDTKDPEHLEGLLYANYSSLKGNTIDKLIWVSSDPSLILLGPENNDPDPESLLYVKPAESIELPYMDENDNIVPVRVIPQKNKDGMYVLGETDVTVYSQNGLVARCKVTVK